MLGLLMASVMIKCNVTVQPVHANGADGTVTMYSNVFLKRSRSPGFGQKQGKEWIYE